MDAPMRRSLRDLWPPKRGIRREHTLTVLGRVAANRGARGREILLNLARVRGGEGVARASVPKGSRGDYPGITRDYPGDYPSSGLEP